MHLNIIGSETKHLNQKEFCFRIVDQNEKMENRSSTSTSTSGIQTQEIESEKEVRKSNGIGPIALSLPLSLCVCVCCIFYSNVLEVHLLMMSFGLHDERIPFGLSKSKSNLC